MDVKKIKVMVVDDSAVIRGMFANVLNSHPDIEVVATAANGKIAVDIMKRKGDGGVHIDVITLDIQMPIMDGLTALPKLIELSPHSKVIMASTLSKEGAAETLEAFANGAADHMAKPSVGADRSFLQDFARELVAKVVALGGGAITSVPQSDKIAVKTHDRKPEGSRPTERVIYKSEDEISLRPQGPIAKKPMAIAIGSSTGGPQALAQFFKGFKNRKINVPIFITQHMPPTFTTLLAKQISTTTDVECIEASDGMKAEAGKAYLAAGGFHMRIKQEDNDLIIHLDDDEPENFCRPAVDPMLRSLVDIYKDKLLVVILTGMGSDGLKGSKQVVDTGGVVIAQDKKSSIVWGMPGAVASAGICSAVLPLEDLPKEVISLAQGQII